MTEPGATTAPPDRDVVRSLAVVEEASKKSAMLWLRPDGAAPTSGLAAWHVWSEGAALLVGGGIEQDLRVLDQVGHGGRVVVTVRSKDTGTRLVSWLGTAHRIAPDNDTWDRAAAELHAKRLNAPDGEAEVARWARESTIWRVEPTGSLVEAPGHMPSGSLAAEPVGSPATTRGPSPLNLGRPPKRRRL